jgi:hypothetical protein
MKRIPENSGTASETPTGKGGGLGLAERQLIGRRMIREAARFVDRHISRQPPVQRFFSFMPTMLTRVSPFHFREGVPSRDWPLVRLDSGDLNSWGRMRLVGELLIIFDETVLFALLSLMSRYQNDAFETTLAEMSGLAGTTPTAANFTAIWKSIQRLSGTRIDLELVSGSGKKRRSLKEMAGSILSFADLHRESGIVRVAINPYFIEMYAESFVTNIDLKFRISLKNDVSKALYRFYQGQIDKSASIELSRLAKAINLDIRQCPPSRMRSRILSGLRELESQGYFEAYEIKEDNRVHTLKARHTALNIEGPFLGVPRVDILPGKDGASENSC